MQPVLEASGLSRSFGAVRAVQTVSFAVSPGEIVGILGPNGAGKTTILRMIAGILTPDEGEVLIEGRNLADAPLELKKKIGFLSGDTQLYQRLSARESLEYFGRLYGMDPVSLRSRVDEMIRRLEMESFVKRPCNTLSAGQKQRANIARAFLHQPDLLVLDEPTNALDVVSGHFIVEAIREERNAGRGVLFSTHIMSEAEYLCDRILLLHEGRVVDQGTLPELLERSGCANLTDTFLKWAGFGGSQGVAA